MHDFVFPRGITIEDCILSRGILLGGHSDMEMEFDSVNMKNDQQVLTKLLSLSTTLRRWYFCLWWKSLRECVSMWSRECFLTERAYCQGFFDGDDRALNVECSSFGTSRSHRAVQVRSVPAYEQRKSFDHGSLVLRKKGWWSVSAWRGGSDVSLGEKKPQWIRQCIWLMVMVWMS